MRSITRASPTKDKDETSIWEFENHLTMEAKRLSGLCLALTDSGRTRRYSGCRTHGPVEPSGTLGKEELSIAENRTSPPQAIWTEERRLVFSTDSSFQEEEREFAQCIDSNSPITSGNSADSLRVMRLIEKIYRDR